MKLRRVLLVTTAFSSVALLGTAAFAQDYDWSGFYVGVGVGGAGSASAGQLDWMDPNNDIWGNTDITGGSIVDVGPEPVIGGGSLYDFPGQLSGFGLLGSIGFNAEMDNFLVGIEADFLTGPFKAEDSFYESGSVSYTTSSTDTLYGSYTLTTPLTSLQTTYLVTSTSFLHTYTSTTTITNGVTTTTSTYTDTYSTFQTTTTVNATSTVEYPTSTVSTDTLTSTVNTTVNTVTTGTESNTYTTVSGTTVVSYGTSGVWTETITGRAQIDWLATIKGRIGVTADRTLFFVTGGLAVGGVTQETSATLWVDGPDGGTTTMWHGENSETRFGFVVGAGIEQALDDHWIISGSAEYFNLGTAEYDVTSSDNTTIIGHQTQVLDGGSVKLGVKYKF